MDGMEALRKRLVFLWIMGWIFLATVGLVSNTHGQSSPDFDHLEPYILIGESGKSIERTASDLIGRLFMNGFEILGRYHPAEDPNRYVIVVTHSYLRESLAQRQPTAAFAGIIRIAITREGEMTYVSCQNPEYWANAYFREDYPLIAESIARFRSTLLTAMPRMRGRFNRPFGASSERPLSAEDIRVYRFHRRAETFDDRIILATFNSFEEAEATLEMNLATTQGITKVFEMKDPQSQWKLYGLALEGAGGEARIFSMLDQKKIKRTASLPYELLVLENQIVILPVRYRLPLSFPDMDRKTFRQLKVLDEKIMRSMSSLVE